MSKLPIAPAYCSRETLADLLDLKPGAIDQLVKRQLLPEPIKIGEAIRWKWTDVEARLADGHRIDADEDADPYTRGLRNGQATAARLHGPQQNGQAIPVLPARARDGATKREGQAS